MRILWSFSAWADADRLHAFAAQRDIDDADAIFDRLAAAPMTLLEFPRRGTRLSEYDPREVRELRAGRYLVRYELAEGEIRVLRLFHVREERFQARSGP